MLAERVGSRRGTRAAVLLGAALVLGGCAVLPRAGPMANQLTATEEDPTLDGLVLPLTAEVAAAVNRADTRGFPSAFFEARAMDPDRIGVGDVLDVIVWEAESTGLLGNGAGPGTLAAVPVEADGSVFVPFAGTIPAAGSTPAQLRRRIRDALSPLTLEPQVDVRLREARSRTLTVQGAVARPGPYVIDRPLLRLTPLLAHAGGATLPPEQAEVVVRRGQTAGSVMLEDVYADPGLDIPLAPDDIVVINALRERFLVLGASSVQREVTFPTRRVDLLRALGQAQGLDDFNADPTGVFLFRYEDPMIATALLPGEQPDGLPAGPGRPVIYRLDMTRPEALFVAKTFQMRDGDAIFVTNAPLTELRKITQLFSSVLAPVQATTSAIPN